MENCTKSFYVTLRNLVKALAFPSKGGVILKRVWSVEDVLIRCNNLAQPHQEHKMHKLLLLLAALAVSFAASAGQPRPVQFDSGSARVDGIELAKYKQHHRKKVWVPAHRSHGRMVTGHYVWR